MSVRAQSNVFQRKDEEYCGHDRRSSNKALAVDRGPSKREYKAVHSRN